MKELEWIGSSKKDLLSFPEEVRQEMGYALHLAQIGDLYHSAKPFKGHGSAVYEIVSDWNKNAYRAVYIAKYEKKIYVLHAFQKKSKSGIKTPKEEIQVIEDRLKRIAMMYK